MVPCGIARNAKMDDSSENFKVTSYNVEWFFENDPGLDGLVIAPFETKAIRLASVLAQGESFPHVLAVQEVENEAVLLKLAEAIKTSHGHDCKTYLGKYTTKRTKQKVGFLVQEHPDLEITEWDSFDWRKQAPLIFPGFFKSSVELEPLIDYFEKNIWICGKFRGKEFLILNFHLKASFDAISTAIRDKESMICEGFIQYLKTKYPKSNMIILGDFNDFDTSFACASPPLITSEVLRKIKTTPDLKTQVPILDYFCEPFSYELASELNLRTSSLTQPPSLLRTHSHSKLRSIIVYKSFQRMKGFQVSMIY